MLETVVSSNSVALGNLLIIQENNNTPDDNASGGDITFTFNGPTDVNSLTFVDMEGNNSYIQVGGNQISIPASGDNGVVTVPVNASGVTSLTVHFANSGAIANLDICSPCNVEGFEGLSAGTNVTTQLAGVGIASVSASGGINQAWIFDTSNPTGGDNDLGTPNSQYGGPGIGNGGASNNTAPWKRPDHSGTQWCTG